MHAKVSHQVGSRSRPKLLSGCIFPAFKTVISIRLISFYVIGLHSSAETILEAVEVIVSSEQSDSGRILRGFKRVNPVTKMQIYKFRLGISNLVPKRINRRVGLGAWELLFFFFSSKRKSESSSH